jgi:hypothetical protein
MAAYTTIDNPELYFQVKTYTGNGSTLSITFDGDEDMQPDLNWTKGRGSTAEGIMDHGVVDSVRGVTKTLRPNTYGEEQTESNSLTAFGSDGYTVEENGKWNYSGSDTYVSWNWKAGTTSGIAGSPSITPTSYSFNSTSGFSIIKFDGTGSAATLPHGLGTSDIGMMIIKNTADVDEGWSVFHKSLGNTYGIKLNGTSAASDDTKYWNDTSPTSTLFTIGDGGEVNGSSNTMIAYCFAEKQGYSKFGEYEGNGDADGTFVNTGFRPAFLLVKPVDATDNWVMFDSKRLGFNSSVSPYYNYIARTAETTDDLLLEFLANGFKIRDAGNTVNRTSTFIYMAFAEAPFVNSNGVPNNAR